jgi:hypothetical protein
MYRPKKRKLVRRVSAASVVAALAATGLGVTLLSQSGATTSNLASPSTQSAATSSANTGATTSKLYVVVRHDDSTREGSSSNDN